MSKIDEKMLQMVVDMAMKGGKMEARQEAKDKEIDELRTVCDELRSEIAKRDDSGQRACQGGQWGWQ